MKGYLAALAGFASVACATLARAPRPEDFRPLLAQDVQKLEAREAETSVDKACPAYLYEFLLHAADERAHSMLALERLLSPP